MIPTGQIFVIGDSHIGLSPGSEGPIIAWLERLMLLKPKALYLNGDLFHYLIADPKFYTPAVASVFDEFKRVRDSGIEIHYVEGNRDFFLRGSFAEKSVTDVAYEYAVPAGTNKYLIVHGDMINDRDYPYRFWRFASKNPVSRFSLKLIPQRTARKFVDSVEKRLAKTNFKHKSVLPLAQMERYAHKRHDEGFTHIVFGHFHEKLVMPAAGATVTILPPWYETGEAMAINPQTGAFDWVVV
ncbi:MAG TPA: metallophosphoesterase [Thermoanaerobaculia bacterium]|nr:metallophosphoesterase [Thermoanaerobaculia bacterium]